METLLTHNSIMYYLMLIFIIILSILKRDQIWKAVVGDDDELSIAEFAQLVVLYIFFVYCLEAIFMGVVVDWVLFTGLIVFALTGQVTSFKSKSGKVTT